ncbi:MAG: GvpL/GvpF family gas vesicle protein [candidate division NC10 bacterium]|nr:GvpL/GvpF family gas vesicle protein [candidate division NC10 bacterium]
MEEGRYLYCIIEENEPKTFGPLGIGGRGDALVSVVSDGLACVVSSSPIMKYRVMREHTMAHYRAIERVMEKYAVLPIRFSTIAESDEEIVEKVLRPRHDEFKRLLHWISGKESVEVRASWTHMDAVFQEVVQDSHSLQALKANAAAKPAAAAYYDRIEIGRTVQAMVKEKRRTTAAQILGALKPHACEVRDNSQNLYADQSICYLAFLVENEKTTAFDRAVGELRAASGEQIKWTVNHRVAPFDFVTIVINLQEVSNVSA